MTPTGLFEFAVEKVHRRQICMTRATRSIACVACSLAGVRRPAVAPEPSRYPATECHVERSKEPLTLHRAPHLAAPPVPLAARGPSIHLQLTSPREASMEAKSTFV